MLKLIVTLSFISFYSCSFIVTPIAGNFASDPAKMYKELSLDAIQLINKSFVGLDKGCLQDFHVHAVGTGSKGTGNWVNPNMQKIFNPFKYIQFNVYMNASGIKIYENADEEYIERLNTLIKSDTRYGKTVLLAFDYNYNLDGEIDKEHSSFYISNDYVYKMSLKYPNSFIPAISVNPNRVDALKELDKWGNLGIHYVKWLPNAMHIDPSNQKYKEFYERVKKYDMAIIVHTGFEKAVEGEEFQEMGNPLLLRYPLNLGTKIIMAHGASLGECVDYDNKNVKKSCFDLFWRVFQNKKYDGLLFGEISAMTLYTRVGNPLLTLLEHPEFHNRLINGSDYPLPAINILYRTGQLEQLGFINEQEKKLLNQIYKFDPLIFDFVLKRTLKHPKTGRKFSDSAFLAPAELYCKK